MAVIYLVEYRLDAGSDPFWELSRATPRHVDGTPTDSGSLGFDGTFEREVVGQMTSLEGTIHFLRSRTGAEFRVSDVSSAWQAAHSNGSTSQRRIKLRPNYDAATQAIKDRMDRQSEFMPQTDPISRMGKPEPWLLLIFIVFIACIIGVAYWFIGDAFQALAP